MHSPWGSLPLEGLQSDEWSSTSTPVRRTRDRFETYKAPTRPMSTAGRPRVAHRTDCPDELTELHERLTRIPWFRERFRWALRDALDDLMDGSRTGRWCYQHLTDPEQKSLPVAVQVTLTREFAFPNGTNLAWNLAGQGVECIFSTDAGGWEIPMSMYQCDEHADRSGEEDATALLVWMNEESNEWAAGLLRITDERLRWRNDKATGRPLRWYSRDNKRRISDEHLSEIFWLWGGIQPDLPENTLLHMLPRRRARIFGDTSSGQRRVDALFRACLGEIVRKPTLLTVAQQDDAPKRVRDSRRKLQPEGVVILGHQESHPVVARTLGLPVPEKGEWLAIRLAPVESSDDRPRVRVGDTYWAVARPDEPVEPAPDISRVTQND